MKARTLRRLLLTFSGVAFLVLVASGAGAFWQGSAAGSGSAGTADTVPVRLAPGRPATALLPGATADVVLTVSNPNAVRLHIGSLSLDRGQGTGGYAVDDAHSGCALSALSFSSASNDGAGWTVPGRVGADDGTASLTLTGAMGMTADAADACQGAVFSVYLKAGP